MEILIKVLQFILSFSLLIIIHELGHFLFAKLFRVRVERFQLFFGRPIVKFTAGDTVYGIGWVPFGGFVTLSGMIDESLNTEQMKEPVKDYEFRSKPAWQRLLIMSGGVLMNLLLAVIVYIGITFTWGDQYLATNDMKWGYVFNDEARKLGFENGDRIVSINDRQIDDFSKLAQEIVVNPEGRVVVERDGKTVEFTMPSTSIMKLLESPDFIAPRYPFIIDQTIEGGGAAEAGLLAGDRLVGLDTLPIRFFDQYQAHLKDYAGRTTTLDVERDSASVATTNIVEIKISDDGKIGAMVNVLASIPVRTRSYTLWQAIPTGTERVGIEIADYWKQLKLIVKPKTEAYKSLGGPLSIGSIFPSEWNWRAFWRITGLLSVILAVMNILPIPALDGGHILFLAVEIVTRRRPGDKFIIYAQVVGMILIFSLMIYATWNDIYRLFIK